MYGGPGAGIGSMREDDYRPLVGAVTKRAIVSSPSQAGETVGCGLRQILARH